MGHHSYEKRKKCFANAMSEIMSKSCNAYMYLKLAKVSVSLKVARERCQMTVGQATNQKHASAKT
eukprot:scaffold300488_cov29-Prasinocladus_malaysianus.AAC.1